MREQTARPSRTPPAAAQWHSQSSQHALPRSPSRPSLAMIGTITSPATGSAHDHPATAFRTNPPKRIAERYVQKSICRESALIAPLPIPAATRRLALASNGITTTGMGPRYASHGGWLIPEFLGISITRAAYRLPPPGIAHRLRHQSPGTLHVRPRRRPPLRGAPIVFFEGEVAQCGVE